MPIKIGDGAAAPCRMVVDLDGGDGGGDGNDGDDFWW